MKASAIKLLRRVKKHVLAEPNRLIMSDVVIREEECDMTTEGGEKAFYGDGVDEYGNHDKIPFARCGTAGCIAGWTVLLHDGMKKTEGMSSGTIMDRAAILLGCQQDEFNSPVMPELFYTDNWNTYKRGLSDRYNRAKTQQERAVLVGEAIEAYIEKNKERKVGKKRKCSPKKR